MSVHRLPKIPEAVKRQRLRAWLEYAAETAIDLLDEMDREDAEREDDDSEDAGWRA